MTTQRARRRDRMVRVTEAKRLLGVSRAYVYNLAPPDHHVDEIPYWSLMALLRVAEEQAGSPARRGFSPRRWERAAERIDRALRGED